MAAEDTREELSSPVIDWKPTVNPLYRIWGRSIWACVLLIAMCDCKTGSKLQVKSFTFAVFTERVSLTLTDRLSSTLKQLDYSDTVNFWLPSARWSKLP